MAVSPFAWCELYDEIKALIKSGALRAEADMAVEAVSPNADPEDFRKAIDRLVDEGVLLRTSPERVVVAQARARSRRGASFQGDYRDQGRSPTIRTIELELVPTDDAPPLVHQTFAPGSMLVRHHHVQSVDGIPHAIAESYVPYDIVRGQWQDIRSGNYDLFEVLSAAKHPVTRKQETLYVDSPTFQERIELGIETMPSVSVVRLDCILYSRQTPVEVCLLCDRADLYEFNYVVEL